MKTGFFLSLTIWFSFLSASSAQAISLSVSPASEQVELGNQVSVDLVISDLEKSSLGAFDLNLNFDPTILAFNKVLLGNKLDLSIQGSLSGASDISFGPGVLDLFEVSLEDPVDLDKSQADSFKLATLTFDSLSLGTSSLALSNNIYLADALGAPLTATLNSGVVTVSSQSAAVPEPTSILGTLVAGTFLIAGSLQRRKQKARL